MKEQPKPVLDSDDIPLPPEANEKEIKDNFDYEVAFKIAIVGVGQCGGRLAETFYKLGYRKVCAINTTALDLVRLSLPNDRKLDLKTGGAGKDPERGAASVVGRETEIYDFLGESFGKSLDYVLVCFGAGGGTGSGVFDVVARIAEQYMSDVDVKSKVGAVIALPLDLDDAQAGKNTSRVFSKIKDLNLSPIVIIDNQKIRDLFRPSVRDMWPTANNVLVRSFHLFNKLAAQNSLHTTFDKNDYAALLDSGLVVFGAGAITDYSTPEKISSGVREQIGGGVLAPVDLKKSKRAGCIFSGNERVLGSIPAESLDYGFSSLARMLAPEAVIHRGIYDGTSNHLRVCVMIGNLPMPESRLKQLVKQT